MIRDGRGACIPQRAATPDHERDCPRGGGPGVGSRGVDLQDRLEALLEGLTVVALADEIVARAVRVGSSTLRTLDAIHLATGLALGPDLTALVTYDAGQADAARALGIAVATPA